MTKTRNARLDVILMMWVAYGFAQAVRDINRLWLHYQINWCSVLIPAAVTGLLTLLLIAICAAARKKPLRSSVTCALYANLVMGQIIAFVVSIIR